MYKVTYVTTVMVLAPNDFVPRYKKYETHWYEEPTEDEAVAAFETIRSQLWAPLTASLDLKEAPTIEHV